MGAKSHNKRGPLILQYYSNSVFKTFSKRSKSHASDLPKLLSPIFFLGLYVNIVTLAKCHPHVRAQADVRLDALQRLILMSHINMWHFLHSFNIAFVVLSQRDP